MGPEDVYLRTSDLDPSSSKCQQLLLRVRLPSTNVREIQSDVEGYRFWLLTPRYRLSYDIPYRINKKSVRAKWLADTSELHVDMDILRDF